MIVSFAEFAYGVLHWSPSDFWGSTPWDLFRAMKGWRRVNGMDKPIAGKLTPEKVQELRELTRIAKEMERKHGASQSLRNKAT